MLQQYSLHGPESGDDDDDNFIRVPSGAAKGNKNFQTERVQEDSRSRTRTICGQSSCSLPPPPPLTLGPLFMFMFSLHELLVEWERDGFCFLIPLFGSTFHSKFWWFVVAETAAAAVNHWGLQGPPRGTTQKSVRPQSARILTFESRREGKG